WAQAEEAVGFGIILDAIQSHRNPEAHLPQGPPFFRFSDEAECERTLREAGFAKVNVTQVPQIWRFTAADELFEAFYNGGVRIKAILRRSEERRVGKGVDLGERGMTKKEKWTL